MMFQLSLTIPDVAKFKARVFREAQIAAMTHCWDEFRRTRLLDRFDFVGTQRALGFEKRSDNYMKRKGKRGKLAHVYTGRTRAAAAKATTAPITPKRGGIRFTAGPQYGRRKPGNIDLQEEISRLSAPDKKWWTELYEKKFTEYMTQALNDPKNLKKTSRRTT